MTIRAIWILTLYIAVTSITGVDRSALKQLLIYRNRVTALYKDIAAEGCETSGGNVKREIIGAGGIKIGMEEEKALFEKLTNQLQACRNRKYLNSTSVAMKTPDNSECCVDRHPNDAEDSHNLAREPGVSVSMSSLYGGDALWSGMRAVDGLYFADPEVTSIAHTNKERSPWIMIDLGKTRCIKAVLVWNRVRFGRFQNPEITVGKEANGDFNLCQSETGEVPAVAYYQCAEVICGRFVRVTGKDMYNYLNLYEIEVHGW